MTNEEFAAFMQMFASATTEELGLLHSYVRDHSKEFSDEQIQSTLDFERGMIQLCENEIARRRKK